MRTDDLDDLSMLDLFRMEAEEQTKSVTSALLVLETTPTAANQLELCMRSAHSLKGAARIVDLAAAVRVAHVMEDCFVAAQHGTIRLNQSHIDTLLNATDLLRRIANTSEQDQGQWADESASGVRACLSSLSLILVEASDAFAGGDASAATPVTVAALSNRTAAAPPVVTSEVPPVAASRTIAIVVDDQPAAAPVAMPPGDQSVAAQPAGRDAPDRVLRVTAENLNRLLGLAGESLVQARWVKPFAESLLRLKRMQHESCRALDALRNVLSEADSDGPAHAALEHAYQAALESEGLLAQRLVEIENFDRRSLNVSHRLYREALACRMRPFADGVQAFPRMVRDLARTLGKEATLEIIGESTQVDRDILSKLDAPLGHLLRNAVDHGLEMPEQRRAAGKPARGVVRLEARHSAGALQVIVSEDGRGVDLTKTRAAVIERNHLNQEAANRLSDAELLEFLFLPGFSMKGTVTDISGRGVGLDVVQDMVKQVRGTVRVSTELGHGTRFVLQLPVTLSVVRTLLAEIGGEPYAFPLACIVRALKLPKDRIRLLEGRQHFDLDGQRIGLLSAHQVLGVDESAVPDGDLPVIVIGDQGRVYGLVVGRLLGERELVVQPLDAQLGKVRNISAGALMDDGSPVLIIDPEDLLRSADKLVSDGRLSGIGPDTTTVSVKKRKKVLVVDDSLTVRELERKLLINHGYEVEVAVDGMDGWNAARGGDFDLIVTDIDMPRMDGIELVRLINADARLKTRPVIVVSYKDREEDRRRGLEAGAAYYLTKGSFHDETLVQAVIDLVGEADAVNIGIVSERPSAVHILQQAVLLAPAHQVIWVAQAADDAVKQCATETPDLLLMDLLKTGTDAVDLVRRIMAGSPCPILMVTDSVKLNAARVFDAMGCGALDAVDIPAAGSANTDAAPLLAKIGTIARLVGVGRGVRNAAATSGRSSKGSSLLVGIGSSAGGPAALAVLLAELPADFSAAIVIVQHVDEVFAAGMTEWLGRQCALPIRLAAEGDRPAGGTILLAGTSDHLILKTANQVGYTPEPRHLVYRPSIDVFLQSVSQLWRGDSLGVLLTGMGRDGALGLKALRDGGRLTIAQDEASSAVYGMPKAAAEIGAAVEVLPLCRIAARLIAYCNEN